jgi:hypothetical protein
MAEDVPVLHHAVPAPTVQVALIALPEEAAAYAVVALMERNHLPVKRNLKPLRIRITLKKVNLIILRKSGLMKSTSIPTTGILQGLQ